MTLLQPYGCREFPTQVICLLSVSARLGPIIDILRRVCSSVGQSAPLIRVRSEVQILPDPPVVHWYVSGAIAQLGEHLLCKQGVVGSIPTGSTSDSAELFHLCVKRPMYPSRVYEWLYVARVFTALVTVLFKNSEVVLTHQI